MMPDQFWSLTPFEAGCIVSGGGAREEREWERAAFVAACTMNASGNMKKQVTPNQLLGRKDKIVPLDPGALAEQLRARGEELERRRLEKGG